MFWSVLDNSVSRNFKTVKQPRWKSFLKMLRLPTNTGLRFSVVNFCNIRLYLTAIAYKMKFEENRFNLSNCMSMVVRFETYILSNQYSTLPKLIIKINSENINFSTIAILWNCCNRKWYYGDYINKNNKRKPNINW